MIAISKTHIRWCLGIAILAHFSIILVLGLSRYWGYMSSINDIGMYDQAVWGGVHGKPFLNTIGFNQQTNWLGHHFNPILILFTPLYAIVPSATWLTLAQALALSLAGLPIFLLASRVFTSEKVGLLWALVYLANPFILNAAAWDFHPITLAVPFVAMSMLSIESKNFRLLLLSCLVILSCKEHLGIMVIGFGFLWWIKNKRWKSAMVLIVIGITHFILVLMIIMPALSPTGEHNMLNGGIGQKGRYTWLGSSPEEVLQAIFTRPFHVLKTVSFEMGGAVYLALILLTFLGLPLAAPEFLLPGLADLACNMLSEVSMPRSPFAYHTASLVPVLIAAAIYGTERISRWNKKFSAKELTGLVFITFSILCYLLAPLPLPGARNHWRPVHFLNLPDPNLSTIRFAIGEEASVSAQANIGSHFSQRREIYRYPNKVGEVDAIILRLESPTNNINIPPDKLKNPRKNVLKMLDGQFQMDRTNYISSIEHLLSGKEYGVFYWNDPWLVFMKGKMDQRPQQILSIEQKLDLLRKEWEIKVKE